MAKQFHLHRLLMLGCVAGLWALTVVIKVLVRPWVFQHGSDWLMLILGSTPSLFAGLSLPLCFLAIQPAREARDYNRACLQAVVIVLVAESVELGLSGSTFDWLDVAASVVGVGGARLAVGVSRLL